MKKFTEMYADDTWIEYSANRNGKINEMTGNDMVQ